MNKIRRISGLIWLILALAAAWFCIFTFGIPRLTSGRQDDLVFGIVILFVLTPIIVGGLLTFGTYALMGEYDDV